MSVLKVVKTAAINAGIKQTVTPHVFRHSFVTRRLESDVEQRQIQVLWAHSSAKTTEIYAHVANRSFMDIKDLLT